MYFQYCFVFFTGLGANKMSVTELWMGFLNFYAGDFDDARLVISIRMSRPLGKFEKMWNSPCIAIEDPFDLSHNLGAGISRKSKIFCRFKVVLFSNCSVHLDLEIDCFD